MLNKNIFNHDFNHVGCSLSSSPAVSDSCESTTPNDENSPPIVDNFSYPTFHYPVTYSYLAPVQQPIVEPAVTSLCLPPSLQFPTAPFYSYTLALNEWQLGNLTTQVQWYQNYIWNKQQLMIEKEKNEEETRVALAAKTTKSLVPVFFMNTKNNQGLSYEGNLYRWVPDRERFRCVEKQCSASADVDGESVVARGQHRHLPNVPKCVATVALAEMRQLAKSQLQSEISEIYDFVTNRIRRECPEALIYIGDCRDISRSLYDARREIQPSVPKTIDELFDSILTASIAEESNVGHFVRIDDQLFVHSMLNSENGSLMMFGTEDGLKEICQSPRIFLDGTFGIVPLNNWYQLVTIHYVTHGEYVLPGAWVLMSTKCQEAYQQIFSSLQTFAAQHSVPWKVDEITCDYETGL